MLRRLVVCLAIAGSFLIARAATASVAVAYDLPTLVGRSEHVVAARVVGASSRYDGNRIVTDVRVAVDAIGKGRARAGETIGFVVLGGSVGGVTMRVEGGVRVTSGDEAVFFLERHPSGVLVPSGMSQGVMPIRESEGRRMVMPGGHGLVLMRRDHDGAMRASGPALAAPEALDTLLDRVRALASQGSR